MEKIVRVILCVIGLGLIVIGLSTIAPEPLEPLPESLCDTIVGSLAAFGGLLLWLAALRLTEPCDGDNEPENLGRSS